METSKGCHARIPPPCGCFYPSRSPNVPIYRYTDVAGWEELCALSSDLHFLPVTSGVSAEHQNTKEWFGGGGSLVLQCAGAQCITYFLVMTYTCFINLPHQK